MNSSTEGPAWWTVELRDRLIGLAREALPNEMVGFWVRTRTGKTVPLPLPARATPHSVDAMPQRLIEQVYAVWSRGDKVIGTYHAHPGDVHAFSGRDQMLFEWGAWHLLISGVAAGHTHLSWMERDVSRPRG